MLYVITNALVAPVDQTISSRAECSAYLARRMFALRFFHTKAPSPTTAAAVKAPTTTPAFFPPFNSFSSWLSSSTVSLCSPPPAAAFTSAAAGAGAGVFFSLSATAGAGAGALFSSLSASLSAGAGVAAECRGWDGACAGDWEGAATGASGDEWVASAAEGGEAAVAGGWEVTAAGESATESCWLRREEAPVGAEAGGREMGLDGSSWAHAVAARTKTSNAAGAMVSVKKVADLRGGLVRFGWWRELESVFYTADAKQSFHLISSPRNFKAKRREPNPTATLTTK
jgi:hypothetical protein